MDEYLQSLNGRQKLAVTTTEGPMLVVAGAGSGKTRVITCKIAHLVHQGRCRPGEILGVTFTNKAAEEMRLRVEGLLQGLDSVPSLSTFHSFCVRVLRRHAERLGYGRDFAICDTDDQNAILKKICKDAGVSSPVRRIRSLISKRKNQSRRRVYDFHYDSDPYDQEGVEPVMARYQAQLEKSNAMDFDDLLLLTDKLFREQPEIREAWSERYRYLLIDEYQDTNASQYALVRHLASTHGNVTAVGDEDQSIYAFRGADVGNILSFEEDFPGAVVVKLEQNYRSRQSILDAAMAVVSHNSERKPKRLWTRNPRGEPVEVHSAESSYAESRFVCRRIERYLQQGETGVAVLYRINFLSRQFEDTLNHFGLPFRLVGGVSFYKRKEVRDALAYLRVARNPRDNLALERIVNTPPRGIGPKSLARLRLGAARNGDSLWDAVRRDADQDDTPRRLRNVLERFVALVGQWRQGIDLEQSLQVVLEQILHSSGYARALEREESEEANNRLLNLQELLSVARDHSDSGRSLQEFLDETALRSEADDYDEAAPVTLMTLHNAKGLEFPIVFLVGMEEKLLPHTRSLAEGNLEEERRLCYVGMTRARKRLILTLARTRRMWGGDVEERRQASSFLAEIPRRLVRYSGPEWSQVQLWGTGHSPGRSGTPGSGSGRTAGVSRSPSFAPGVRVEHPEYGHGIVLQVQKVRDDLKLTVSFSGRGKKMFYQRYARVKLL